MKRFSAIFVLFSLFGHGFAKAAGKLSRELDLMQLRELVSSEAGQKALEEEFLSIGGGQRHSWSVAEKPENLKKNRYEDLLAFDHSRVVLEPPENRDLLPPDHTDYINANYMDSFNREREYVATQGPLANTEVDFWRMVWQVNATKIVMLANLFEHDKPKVHKYWPDSEGVYGEITITKIGEHEMADIQHVLRIFKLKKNGVSKARIVRHFHFTGWPDLGVPADRMSVVALMRQVRHYDTRNSAPIVVHCSAGIGRTGTIILMDSMIKLARAEGHVDFAKRLDHMRDLRVDVVEKKEQYVFAHKALDDLFNNRSSKAYLEKVKHSYEDWEQKYLSEKYSPSGEIPNLIKKMETHIEEMSDIIKKFKNEHRKDVEFHIERIDSPVAAPGA